MSIKEKENCKKREGEGKGRAKGKTPAATGYDCDENCTMCNGHYVNGED